MCVLNKLDSTVFCPRRYLVNGLGGAGIYSFKTTVEPGSQFRFNSNQ